MAGNIKCFGENLPVPTCLVKHVNKITVLEDVLNFTGREQILDILGNSSRDTAPFSKALPYFY